MTLHTTLHLHNTPEPRLADYASWFDGPHRAAVEALDGFVGADRYEIAETQLMGDALQPWRFVSVYDFDIDDPAAHLPALGEAIAPARERGLVAADDAERLYTYRLFGDWKGSANWRRDLPLSGVSVLIGNYVPGHYEAYQAWYENIHSVEVANVPGHVAMKRGELCDVQIEPRRHCPGDQLVMTAQQTDDLGFTINDFVARALGNSPSGIAMQPRSNAGSLARTVHYFTKTSGSTFWPGGIAYAGDLSVYPDKP